MPVRTTGKIRLRWRGCVLTGLCLLLRASDGVRTTAHYLQVGGQGYVLLPNDDHRVVLRREEDVAMPCAAEPCRAEPSRAKLCWAMAWGTTKPNHANSAGSRRLGELSRSCLDDDDQP